MSNEQELPPAAINRQQAAWCYAHASRPVAEVESLDDDECAELAELAAKVLAGEVRLDVELTEFLAARGRRLAEAKAVDADSEPTG